MNLLNSSLLRLWPSSTSSRLNSLEGDLAAAFEASAADALLLSPDPIARTTLASGAIPLVDLFLYLLSLPYKKWLVSSFRTYIIESGAATDLKWGLTIIFWVTLPFSNA